VDQIYLSFQVKLASSITDVTMVGNTQRKRSLMRGTPTSADIRQWLFWNSIREASCHCRSTVRSEERCRARWRVRPQSS